MESVNIHYKKKEELKASTLPSLDRFNLPQPRQKKRAMSTSNPHPTPHLTLLSTTFSVNLPSYQDMISNRFSKVARLHHEVKHNSLATGRSDAVDSLKVELEMLTRDLSDYESLVLGIEIAAIARLYVVGGMEKHEAFEMAKLDKQDVEASLRVMQERVGKLELDVTCAVEGRED